MDKKEYRKFGGRTGNLTGYSSIWLADDHLLVCEGSFIEKYKRFYFKDIQALIVKKTNNRLLSALVTFVLAMGFLWSLTHAIKGWDIFPVIFTLMTGSVRPLEHATEGWRIFWGILAGFFFLLLVIILFRGQSCKTYIQTAVQEEELKGLNRVKRFKEFLKIIKPLIQSSQGEIDRDTLESKYEEFLEKSKRAKVSQSRSIEQDSLLHTVLFSLLIVLSFFIGAVYFLNNVVLYYLILIIYLIVLILNIRAVVKQLKINLKPAISNWAWVSLVYEGMFLLMGYVALFAIGFMDGLTHRHRNYYSGDWILNSIPDNHFVKSIILVAFFASLLIGVIGLILSARPRSDDKPLV